MKWLLLSILLVGCSQQVIVQTKYKMPDVPSQEMLITPGLLPPYADAKSAGDVAKKRGDMITDYRNKLIQWQEFYKEAKQKEGQ